MNIYSKQKKTPFKGANYTFKTSHKLLLHTFRKTHLDSATLHLDGFALF